MGRPQAAQDEEDIFQIPKQSVMYSDTPAPKHTRPPGACCRDRLQCYLGVFLRTEPSGTISSHRGLYPFGGDCHALELPHGHICFSGQTGYLV